MITIAFDAMGGDFAPASTVEGANIAIEENKNLKIILTGYSKAIKRIALKSERLEILDAPDAIKMDEPAARAIKSKPNSSLVKAIELVKKGGADGFLSAGNTGAIMAGALLKLGRIKGLSRPAIAVIIPTSDKPVVLLDAGANTDSKAEYLHEFAEMGSAFYSSVFHKKSPEVGLLNIGEEKSKGDDIIKKAHRLIEEDKYINFLGNIEGRDISSGKTDVVVCDGFTGNVVLKTMEGLAGQLFKELKSVINESFITKSGGLLLSRSLKELYKRLNQDTYGGAHLLGVNGICVISHGSANKIAIKNALKLANETVEGKMIDRLGSLIAGGNN